MARYFHLAALSIVLSIAALQIQPAKAQLAHKPASTEADKFGDALAGTQTYLERRWMVFQIRMLLVKIAAVDPTPMLSADAQRLGTKGPTAQETAQLDAELAREIDAYLAHVETLIRNPAWGAWPKDKSPTNYTNAALIRLETIRLEVAEARAKNRDYLPAMRRAVALLNLGSGFRMDLFPGRDEIVEAAMRSITMAKPAPPKR